MLDERMLAGTTWHELSWLAEGNASWRRYILMSELLSAIGVKISE